MNLIRVRVYYLNAVILLVIYGLIYMSSDVR